jgi:hypothetical protein
MARTCFNSILDGAAEFCDAEWPSRRCDARFSRVRCVLATSLATEKSSEKVVFESPLRDVFSSSASLRYLRSQVACPPREDDEGDDQESDNQHPILHLDAKNTDFLNEKLHLPAPLLCKLGLLAQKLYYFATPDESVSLSGVRRVPICQQTRAFDGRLSFRTLPAAGLARQMVAFGRREVLVRPLVVPPVAARAACRTRLDRNGCRRGR